MTSGVIVQTKALASMWPQLIMVGFSLLVTTTLSSGEPIPPAVVVTSGSVYRSITQDQLQRILTKKVSSGPDNAPIVVIYNTKQVTYDFVERVLHMPREKFKKELRRNQRRPVVFLSTDAQVLRRMTGLSIGILVDLPKAKSRLGRDILELSVEASPHRRASRKLPRKGSK